MMRQIQFVSIVLSWILSTAPIYGNELPKEVNDVYDRLQALLVEYYPKAVIERKDGTFHGKLNTRMFMIHHAFKTGEWQEARAQEGPNRGGIICTVESSLGQWQGAAMVPQSFDYRYYTSLLICPFNKKLNRHLVSHLDYPSDISNEFIKRYQKLISVFALE